VCTQLPEIPNQPLCPVGALKSMFLLSSDSVFTFTTPLGTKPLLYGKFTKDLKGLLKQLGLCTGYSSHSFRRGGASFMLQVGIPGEMIKLMGDWRSDLLSKIS